MKSTMSTLATILVVIIVLWLGLKLIGVAIKAVVLLAVIDVVVAVYFAARKKIGKGR